MPIIHLSDTDTKAFDENHLIQQVAKEKFEKLVQGFIKSLSDKANDENYRSHSFRTETSRVHNTILINGKRGMGKTSFILSILDQKNQKASWLDEVCNLRIIDPTMIESKEHIFLNIIVRIKKKIEEYRNSNCYKSDNCFQEWKDSLKKLAGGLCVLDGVGSDPLKNDLWDSPELILEKGLVNSKQGSELEQNFHLFLDASLVLLEKKVFLLVLDDIDTSLKEGKAILEILRKYLTSRKLIIVMLGDIDLYATIVRQLQWEKMDPNEALLKYEKDGSEIKGFYRSQIEHLEEQYLTKLLKPENRIKLQAIQEMKKHLTVQCDKEDEQSLTDVVARLIETVFLTKPQAQYAKLYEQTLLAQSTRSVVQVLRGARDSGIICPKESDKNQLSPNAFVEVLRQLFFTTLKKNLEPFDLLYTTKDRSLLNRVAVYMLKQAISRDSHMKLLPEYRDDEKNITMLFLNAEINAQLTPQHYLSYMIKVGYALERFGDAEKQQGFFDHVGLDSDISNANIARRLLSTIKIDFNSPKSVFFGNFFLSGKGGLEKSKLALFMSYVISPKKKSYMYISFLNLLGILADISMSIKVSADGELDTECQKILESCRLIRGIHSYNIDAIGGSFNDGVDKYYDMPEFDIDAGLIKDICIWGGNVLKINQMLSMADLANIWVRFSYSLNEIDSRSENSRKDYAEMLELYVAAFLNAVYVCCEEKRGKQIDITNPSTSPNHFYNKLVKYHPDEKEWTFFDYLLVCPVFNRGNDYKSPGKYYDSLLRELKKIIRMDENKKKTGRRVKIDFSVLLEDVQINLIRKIAGFKNMSNDEIRKELQKDYKNVKSNIDSLIEKAKG
ncbi:MAG: hypothetical protein HGB27_01640 [Chlorobiaceae bacterium]|nr:hypothetical protein [Chlorobiaceae bacterium]